MMANFSGRHQREVPRISLPRTPVNNIATSRNGVLGDCPTPTMLRPSTPRLCCGRVVGRAALQGITTVWVTAHGRKMLLSSWRGKPSRTSNHRGRRDHHSCSSGSKASGSSKMPTGR